MMSMENFLVIQAGFRWVQMKELLVNSFWNNRCAEVEGKKPWVIVYKHCEEKSIQRNLSLKTFEFDFVKQWN